jgi:hypothetical protein
MGLYMQVYLRSTKGGEEPVVKSLSYGPIRLLAYLSHQSLTLVTLILNMEIDWSCRSGNITNFSA